jgi:hypothetical protein
MMKKSFLVAALMLLSVFSINAQELPDNDAPKKSEISTNLLDLVVAGSLTVNYERLFENNQSLMVGATFFDTYGYYDAGYINNNTTVSVKASYLIYFSKKKDHAGFFFYPQLKVRTGEITVDDGYYNYDDATDSYFEVERTYDLSGVSAGFGLGHKWLFSNKFTLSVNADISRNIGNYDEDYLDPVELRLGVNFGYRF